VLVMVLAILLLARERKLGLRLIGIRDCLRALSLLALLVAVSYLFFYLISLRGWATSIELTKEFWLALLLSAFAVSLACFALAKRGRRSLMQYAHRGILFFGTVHKLGRIRAERAQILTVLFGLGLLWWSFVAAPAIYSGRKAYHSFHDSVHGSAVDGRQINLQTNLIVTATALDDVPGVIPLDGSEQRLALAAGDIYFCFSGQQVRCPEREKVQSKRWFEIRDHGLASVIHPVFASGSPFPIFPPHLVKWHVADTGEPT